MAEKEMKENRRYQWLKAKNRQDTERVLLNSRALILTSKTEGGANVISEAIVADRPIIATRIPCTEGLLGTHYPGLFPVGDTRQLASLMRQVEVNPDFHAQLQGQCRAKRHHFAPAREKAALRGLFENLELPE